MQWFVRSIWSHKSTLHWFNYVIEEEKVKKNRASSFIQENLSTSKLLDNEVDIVFMWNEFFWIKNILLATLHVNYINCQYKFTRIKFDDKIIG